MTDAILSVHGICKSFGGLQASKNITLDLRAGEIHALIGPNGAGKSTLIKQIAGSERPDAGKVMLAGRDVTALDTPARARLGLARTFQISELAMEDTVLQSDPQLAKIKTSISKKVLSELKKKATKSPEEYAAFWGNFGAVLKEGLVEEVALRDRILEICRFASTSAKELTSLTDYVSRMKTGQDAIFYIAGDDAAKLAKSPHLEGFKAKGVEVLLLSDHVDEFWLQHITEHEGKPFKSITRGAADLDQVEADETNEDVDKPEEADLSALITAIKAELGDAVKDVRPSKRLTDSPVCLIADDGDMDVNLERLLKRHGQLAHGMPRVLELNPSHALITTLAARSTSNAAGADDLLKDAAHLLLDQARIVEGEVPTDPSVFARRLGAVMARAFDV